MGKSDAKGPQNQGAECRFSLKQYSMLKRCSEKKDITEWNEWRLGDPSQAILLEGADLGDAYLEGADLFRAHLQGATLTEAHLEGAVLLQAHLEGAKLEGAHLEGADLRAAHMEGAKLRGAHLEDAKLSFAHLEGAVLRSAHLEGAFLCGAHLEGAVLWEAHLEGADLSFTHLERAELGLAHLEGAKFTMAAVDGNTLIDGCQVDRDTDFTGVGLDSARVRPGLKQLLQYNVRRIRWQKWYEEGDLGVRKVLVHPFWWTCDYGRSTKRILGVFFGLALIFAVIYWAAPGCLVVRGGELKGFLHALYFSVVTMTTLGFGDIHASPGSVGGQLLLMGQVILGYILLGALVTRFAVLFQAGGPSAKFPDEGIWKKVAPLVRPYAHRARVSFCARNRIGRPVLRHALRLRRRLRTWRRH